MYRTLAQIEREADLFLPDSSDPRLKRALDFTATRPDARLPEVCAVAGMSERSLRRHLKQETGMSWEAHRQRSRLLRAIALLSESNLAVTEVAAQCGFESPAAFAKAFRAVLHEAPSDYRRRVQAG